MKLFVLAMLIGCIASGSEPEKPKPSSAYTSVMSLYQDFDTQSKALMGEYPEFEKQIREIENIQSTLAPLEAAYLKNLSTSEKNKKNRDEAEAAIVEAKVSEGRTKLDILAKKVFEKYPFAASAVVKAYHKGKSRPKMSLAFVEKAISDFKKSGLGNGFPTEECFTEKDGFVLTKSCVKSGLEFCQKRFTLENNQLGDVGLDSELEVTTTVFKSQDEFDHYDKLVSASSKSQNDFEELRATFARASFSACRMLADRKISFRQKTINFTGDTPAWVNKLSYGWAGGPESLNEKCLTKSGVPKDIFSKFSRLKANYEIQYPLNSVESGINACQKAVGEICENTFEAKGKMIFSYSTKGCSVREVTADDVESDIKEWRNAGTGEADIISHSTLLDVINLCKQAQDYGYSWNYKKPIVSKRCKAPRRS